MSASFTVAPPHPWPAGTTVSLYAGSPTPSGLPSGSAVTTAVVGSDLTLTFSGLTEGARYFAYANGQYISLTGGADVAQAALAAVAIDICRPWGVHAGVSPGDEITTVLQAAIDYIAANYPNGGDIYASKPGQYNINGAPRTGTAQGYTYNGQILIPAVAEASSMTIRIRGAVPASTGGSSTGAPNGLILKSNATAGYVFDIIPAFTQFGCPWTGVMPVLEDVIVRTTDNPTCGGVNFLCTQRAKLERVTIDTPSAFVAPVAGTLEAYVMPQIYNNGDITMRDLNIRGYPIGIRTSEHGVLDNVFISYCMTAFKGGGISHTNWFGYVDVEECPTIFDGGSAPAFGSPTPAAGIKVVGTLDFENNQTGSLKPIAFVNDTPTNRVSGKLDIQGTFAGTHPTNGGKYLDLVPVDKTPTVGSWQRGAGWMESHPYDNFARLVALSGTGAPGQTAPSMHPWRVDSGSFTVSGALLKSSSASSYAFVPCLRGGVARTIQAKVTLGVGGEVRIVGQAPVAVGEASVAVLNAIHVKLVPGSQPTLRANNTQIAVGGPTLAAATLYRVDLQILYGFQAASSVKQVDYPVAAKVFIDGVFACGAAIPQGLAALGAAGGATWPLYEDGVGILDNALSSVSLFYVRDSQPDPPSQQAGTATLVAGTVTVANTAITANSVIRYWRTTAGGTLGFLSLTLTAGTSFTITSSSGTDTSTIYYEIVSL